MRPENSPIPHPTISHHLNRQMPLLDPTKVFLIDLDEIEVDLVVL